MLSRATSLIAVATLSVTAAAAGTFMTAGNGHCDHHGVGTGHSHHDDDCSADSPTPTPGSTDTPIATVTATVVVTVTVTPSVTPAPEIAPAGLVWKDATGVVVPRVHLLSLRPTGIGGPVTLTYTDARGLIWSINQWTLALTVPEVGQSPKVPRMFETSNCTGDWFLYPDYGFPRMPFLVDNDPTIRVVPDAPSFAIHSLHSYDGGPGSPCTTSWSNTLNVIPGAETVPAEPITIPTLPYIAPIHPEAG